MMTRRSSMPSAAAPAAAATLPTAGRAGAAPSLRPDGEPVPGVDPAVARILSLAALAPSSHNVQPWRVRVAGAGSLVVGLDDARRLPEVDPSGREMLLSLGCFLENLAQAAQGEGLPARIGGVGGAGAVELSVELEPGPVVAGAAGRIRGRRTLRSGQRTDPLRGEDVDAILALAGPGARWCPRGSRQARAVAEATVEAMRQQTWRDGAQRELAGWVRFRDRDVQRARDGLTVEAMEAGGVTGFAMRHFFDASSVTGKTFREKGVELCARQVTEGAGFLVLEAPDEGAAALIEAGRRFERVALSLRERSIAAHPMSQALEEEAWRRSVAGAVGVAGPLQFLVRLGYVDRYPEPVSPRRALTAFVV